MTATAPKVKRKIKTIGFATGIRQLCEALYGTYGSTKVYDYANKVKLLYNDCKPCEASTPTISDVHSDTCAICGSNKYL